MANDHCTASVESDEVAHFLGVHVKRSLQRRFIVELGGSLASSAILILTLVWRDWIEIVFRLDPDHHSGAAEWAIVAFAFVATAALGSLAGRDWRALAASSSAT